jgi:hypothetical protein
MEGTDPPRARPQRVLWRNKVNSSSTNNNNNNNNNADCLSNSALPTYYNSYKLLSHGCQRHSCSERTRNI